MFPCSIIISDYLKEWDHHVSSFQISWFELLRAELLTLRWRAPKGIGRSRPGGGRTPVNAEDLTLVPETLSSDRLTSHGARQGVDLWTHVKWPGERPERNPPYEAVPRPARTSSTAP
jgi:hypothetical protein